MGGADSAGREDKEQPDNKSAAAMIAAKILFKSILLCRRAALLSLDLAFPALVTHGDIAVIAAEENLIAVGDDVSGRVDARVDGRLAAAGADGFDLGDGVGKLHEPACAGEEVRKKIRAQTEAQNRQILVVNELPQLVYLLGSEKLRLIGDYNIVLPGLGVGLDDVLLGGYDLCRAL